LLASHRVPERRAGTSFTLHRPPDREQHHLHSHPPTPAPPDRSSARLYIRLQPQQRQHVETATDGRHRGERSVRQLPHPMAGWRTLFRGPGQRPATSHPPTVRPTACPAGARAAYAWSSNGRKYHLTRRLPQAPRRPGSAPQWPAASFHLNVNRPCGPPLPAELRSLNGQQIGATLFWRQRVRGCGHGPTTVGPGRNRPAFASVLVQATGAANHLGNPKTKSPPASYTLWSRPGPRPGTAASTPASSGGYPPPPVAPPATTSGSLFLPASFRADRRQTYSGRQLRPGAAQITLGS